MCWKHIFAVISGRRLAVKIERDKTKNKRWTIWLLYYEWIWNYYKNRRIHDAFHDSDRAWKSSSFWKSWFISTFIISTGNDYRNRLYMSVFSRFLLEIHIQSCPHIVRRLLLSCQTASMLQGSGLSIVPYITQKLITAGVTSLLAVCYLFFFH